MKKTLPATGQGLEVWINWYEDRLDGRVRDEQGELAYVQIDDTLWKQGPAIVNAEIKRRIEHREPAPPLAALLQNESPATRFSINSASIFVVPDRPVLVADTLPKSTSRCPTFLGFFSYTHRDAEVDPNIVEAFSEELEKRVDANLVNAKFEIWRDDKKPSVGDYWDQSIETAIKSAHVLIVLLTPKWISSDYCHKEIETFEQIEGTRNSEGYVIPIYGRDIEGQTSYLEKYQKELFERIKRRQYKQVIPAKFGRLSDAKKLSSSKALPALLLIWSTGCVISRESKGWHLLGRFHLSVCEIEILL